MSRLPDDVWRLILSFHLSSPYQPILSFGSVSKTFFRIHASDTLWGPIHDAECHEYYTARGYPMAVSSSTSAGSSRRNALYNARALEVADETRALQVDALTLHPSTAVWRTLRISPSYVLTPQLSIQKCEVILDPSVTGVVDEMSAPENVGSLALK